MQKKGESNQTDIHFCGLRKVMANIARLLSARTENAATCFVELKMDSIWTRNLTNKSKSEVHGALRSTKMIVA